ncbi:MAG: integrin alpha, partial [bacterium]
MKHGVVGGVLVVVFMYAMVCSALAINRIDLSRVQASFVGGQAEDWASQFLSIGDVNGDGYADLLIGAQGSDAGGNHAGQIYLIFGQPGGWQMRTPVSEADASFVGEEEWDGVSNVSI